MSKPPFDINPEEFFKEHSINIIEHLEERLECDRLLDIFHLSKISNAKLIIEESVLHVHTKEIYVYNCIRLYSIIIENEKYYIILDFVNKSPLYKLQLINIDTFMSCFKIYRECDYYHSYFLDKTIYKSTLKNYFKRLGSKTEFLKYIEEYYEDEFVDITNI